MLMLWMLGGGSPSCFVCGKGLEVVMFVILVMKKCRLSGVSHARGLLYLPPLKGWERVCVSSSVLQDVSTLCSPRMIVECCILDCMMVIYLHLLNVAHSH